MAAIILPRRWQQQPTGPVEIDWRNPLTQGMAHCYLGGESYHVNLVTRGQDGTQTGRMGCEARPEGLATAGTGSAYMVDTTNAPQSLPLTIGVMAGGRPNALGPVLASFTPGSVGSAAAFVATDFIGNAFPRYTIDLDSAWLEISDTDARSSLVNTSRAYVCRSLSSTDHALIVGRRITSSTASKNVVVAGAQFGLGRVVAHNYNAQTLPNTAWFHVAAMWYRGLSDAEAFEFNAAPFQLFVPRRQALYFDVGGATTHDLEAAAAAQASSAAALSVVVPLGGAGLSVATTAGALSISIPLDGAAPAVADASGDLSAIGNAGLAGNATATATTSGDVSLIVPLTGAAVAQALSSAGLDIDALLAGDGAADSSGVSTLTLNITLSGSAISEAASSAGLTVSSGNDLAGDAQAQAAASADMSLSVPLTASAVTVTNTDGSLTQIVPISSAAASASLADGGLDVAVVLDGAALAQALAFAGLAVGKDMAGGAAAGTTADVTLSVRVNLSGASVAQAIAAGALDSNGLIVAGTPRYIVSRSARTWHVSRTPRTWRVAA